MSEEQTKDITDFNLPQFVAAIRETQKYKVLKEIDWDLTDAAESRYQGSEWLGNGLCPALLRELALLLESQMPHAPKKSPLKQLWLLTNKESSDPEISAPLIDILCNKYKGQWNLKDIDVNDWALSNDNIGKFCAFLKTQKNLETLDIGTYANLTVSKVKQVMNAIEANFKAAGNAQKTFRIRKGTNFDLKIAQMHPT